MTLTALPRRMPAAAVVTLCTLALVACGGSKKSSSGSSSATSTSGTSAAAPAGADPAVVAKVPPAIKSKGTLVVAADATYAPNEFIGPDGKTIEGMDPDLAKALARVMGLRADVRNATFDSIIPGLSAHRFDMGMSSFTDTKEREKTVDFVTYFSAGTSFYEKKGGPAIKGLADLCGKTVAVEKGTTQQNDATAQSAKCGGSKVTVLTFPDQNGANLALSSGRAQIGMADSPVADYQVKQSGGRFVLVGQTYGTAPYGIALPKGTGLPPALQAALQTLMKNGTYTTILKKWGVESGAISTPVINGAQS